MLKFSEEHEWIAVEGDVGTVGITDYAQAQLGDIVFVEVPEVGRKLTKGGEETLVSRTNASLLYWTAPQQLAHATVNGTNVRPGDLYASGTISGADPDSRGSLLELSWGGRDPLALAGGDTRTFLEDGDTVVLRGAAGLVSLGEVRGRILPAV